MRSKAFSASNEHINSGDSLLVKFYCISKNNSLEKNLYSLINNNNNNNNIIINLYSLNKTIK